MDDAQSQFLVGTVEIVDFGTNPTNVVNSVEKYHAERAGAKNKQQTTQEQPTQ